MLQSSASRNALKLTLSKSRRFRRGDALPQGETPRKKQAEFFTVVFYGLRKSRCKTAQFCVTRYEYLMTETPSICDAVQRSENTHKISFLIGNPLLYPAELRAQIFCGPIISSLDYRGGSLTPQT
jgi:hypothetical protein